MHDTAERERRERESLLLRLIFLILQHTMCMIFRQNFLSMKYRDKCYSLNKHVHKSSRNGMDLNSYLPIVFQSGTQ